jgi:enediyne biosynthesis protein E5
MKSRKGIVGKLLSRLRKIDNRYLFLMFFIPVLGDHLVFGTHLRTVDELLVVIAACVGFDILFNLIRHRVWTFPLSGLVTACGTFMLVWSPFYWPYVVAGFLAPYSKQFITFRGRHVFNPTSFGVGTTIYFLKDYAVNGGSFWSGYFILIPYLWIVGILLTIKARRLPVSLAFAISYVVINLLFFYGRSPENLVVMAAPAYILYIFFMISDPKTTPSSLWGQIAFGTALAALDGFLKTQRVLSAQLWSLMVLNVVYSVAIPLIKDLFPKGEVARSEGMKWQSYS